MPRLDLTVEIDIERTPRVKQLEGLFDVPEAKRRSVDFHFDVPIEDKDWKIGLITGPSGAGKTLTAKHLFPDSIVDEYNWEPRKSMVDSFGDISINEVTKALSSVGFSSPPSWMKPYHVLSNGEQFRSRVARAILDPRDLVVMDEFTSVVDRTVAKIGSCAVAKTVRRRPNKRFVAVSCHDDIVEWLQPDWILEPHIGRFRWRSVQPRPSINLELVRCDYSSWQWFAKHHYLTANLHRAARCFVGLIDGRPAYFAGLIHFPHPKAQNLTSISRVVVTPDYQGVGLSYAGSIMLGKILRANGRVLITHPAHPELIESRARSPMWKMTSAPKFGNPSSRSATSTIATINPKHTEHRRVAHFRYIGPSFTDQADIEKAKKLWSNEDEKNFAALRTKALRSLKKKRRR